MREIRSAPAPIAAPSAQIIMQHAPPSQTVIHNVVQTSSHAESRASAHARSGGGCLAAIFRAILWIIVIVVAVVGVAIWWFATHSR